MAVDVLKRVLAECVPRCLGLRLANPPSKRCPTILVGADPSSALSFLVVWHLGFLNCILGLP